MLFDYRTHPGCNKEKNEDALGFVRDQGSHMFVVCDGVGGLPNGSFASKKAVQSIIKQFSISPNSSKARLRDAVDYGQKAVFSLNPKPLGTTMVACVIEKMYVYSAWCGDSRIYHIRNKEILWHSYDHNILHDILNKGAGNKKLFMNPRALNRFLGKDAETKSDFHSFSIINGDYILLCTDGLSNYISEDFLVDTITNNHPDEISNILESHLLSNKINAPDNFTWYIILI